MRNVEVDTGGTYQLAYDDTLGSVDNERTCLGHEGEVAHEYLMVLNYILVLFIVKSNFNLEGRRVSRITFLTLFNGILNVILA